DTNGDRTRENMKTKLLSGGWTWIAPDGYLNQEIKSSTLSSEEKLKNARYKRYVVADEKQLTVWRYAWKLLLEKGLSLIEICEAVHARGYRLRNNTPFVRVKNNRRTPNVGALSRGFHNWFYAGWVVVDNDWVSIPPKTVRGDWEPAVSTEDFEAGLAILEKRNMSRSHRRKHFYLLQNLIWLEKTAGNKPLKLI